jgi:DNA-binding XRE family transcriptional regulator
MNQDIKRFETYVNKTDECWLWIGGKDVKNYGIFFYKGKTQFAHRVSLLLYNKVPSLTPGLQVRHSCRNTCCVNPDHLSEGTRQQNAEDKRRDGTNLSGTRCHFSKLDWEKVSEIRSSVDMTRQELTKKYGVSSSSIGAILTNKSWNLK